jgi:hypothetical protein
VPLPQAGEVAASELVLVLDDVSAHDARRNLEVLVNDRTVIAVVLDGKSRGRSIRVPLTKARPKDGFLKLSFLYSGAATLDRCIDVRYVGDSLTRPPSRSMSARSARSMSPPRWRSCRARLLSFCRGGGLPAPRLQPPSRSRAHWRPAGDLSTRL